MSNDGTGLREAELDARTIYDIACIRADASNATREDVEFKAIALRNYKAIAALSAVAPPPVLEGCAPGWGIAGNYGDGKWRCFREGASQTYLGYPKATANEAIAETHRLAMLAASPAAPAQPEGGEAVRGTRYERHPVLRLHAAQSVAKSGSGAILVSAAAVHDLFATLDALYTHPAPAQQDSKRLDFLEATGWPGQFGADPSRPKHMRWFDCETTGSDYSPTLRAAIDAALASNAAASAADAQECSDEA